MAEMPVSPAAFPEKRPPVHSGRKRGQDYGRNGHFPLPRFRKIGLLCVLPRNAAGEAGWGVHEGIGGKGDARGPCARSGAALQHDGVRSRTVRHAEGGAKRDALAVKRLGRPPFPPLTEGIPHPAAGRIAPLDRGVQGQKRHDLHLDRDIEGSSGAKTPLFALRPGHRRVFRGKNAVICTSTGAPNGLQGQKHGKLHFKWLDYGAGLLKPRRPVPGIGHTSAGTEQDCKVSADRHQEHRRPAPRTPQTCARNTADLRQESATQALGRSRTARFQQTGTKNPTDLHQEPRRPAPKTEQTCAKRQERSRQKTRTQPQPPPENNDKQSFCIFVPDR